MAIPFITINLDKPRKLRFGMGAMVEFEQITGIKLMSLGDEISIDTASKILWVMLKQEDETLTLKEMLNLIDDYADNITSVMEKVTQAIQSAFQSGERPNAGKPKK